MGEELEKEQENKDCYILNNVFERFLNKAKQMHKWLQTTKNIITVAWLRENIMKNDWKVEAQNR